MLKKIKPLILLCIFLVYPLVFAQGKNSNTKTITITARLKIKPASKKDSNTKGHLILHADDGQLYHILKNNLTDKFNTIFTELGKNNLITTKGTIDGRKNTNCNTYFSYDDNGKRKGVDVQCEDYLFFEPIAIDSYSESDLKLPKAKRAIERERASLKKILSEPPPNPGVVGQFFGTIVIADTRSVVKHIVVENEDKNNRIKKMSFMVTSTTQIAKKTKSDLLVISPKRLKKGQKVTIMYLRNNNKIKATSILIK